MFGFPAVSPLAFAGGVLYEEGVLTLKRLGFPWQTRDPFLFCAHHDDAYPKANESMGPDASLAGRALGQDFEVKDGFRMYHGTAVPGFPGHPHRGFETVTVVRRGLIDHADSLGAAARYGGGDVQWLTAGRGIQHSEMFPLLDREKPNRLELFQIWLNLPAANKMVEPHFSMFWNETIPRQTFHDHAERPTDVTVIAGSLGALRPLPPPPHSWAGAAESHVAIWTIKMAPDATWVLPEVSPSVDRTLYFFRGRELQVNQTRMLGYHSVELPQREAISLVNGPEESELLLLQGRPIGEPVAQYGPFVMNTRDELQQAFADYRRTGFGGWPWPAEDPVHPRGEGRFARHADGRIERGGEAPTDLHRAAANR